MKVGVLTISDGCAQGTRKDESGDVLVQICAEQGWQVMKREVVPDVKTKIQKSVLEMVEQLKVDLILTTGGTGLGPRDVTPEAMKEVFDREVPGLGELMRSATATKAEKSWLSRALAGTRKSSLIVCFAGSPKAVREMFDAVGALIPHGLDMMKGGGHA